MARKRKRKSKKKSKQSLKYEVYGIVIIVLSIISLAGFGNNALGSVGWSLSNVFMFLTGRHYYVIPLIAIYVGLFVMIKRAWPLEWSLRRTGILLIIFGFLVTEHIALYMPAHASGAFTAGQVFTQPYYNVKAMIQQEVTNEVFMSRLGGGMIGALIYGTLYFLFADLGSKLVVVAMFAIGLLCLTGWSYVEMGRKLKQITLHMFKQVRFRLGEIVYLLRGEKAGANRRETVPEPIASDESPVEPEYEPYADGETPLIRDFEEQIEPPHPEPDRNAEDEAEYIHAPQSEEMDVQPETEVTVKDQDIPFQQDASALSKPYQLPSFHLLDKPEPGPKSHVSTDYRANAKKLEETLESFGVRAKVVEVVRGPTVTRYEVQPDTGVKVSRIVSLTDDIALALAAKDIRMEAPIPGKAAIGIEVPNSTVSMVTLREVMESSAFHEAPSPVSIGLGRDISGQPIVADLAKMPHLLVAGATGSGKSVCINGIIVSILYKAKPDEVKFLMIDPKKVELNGYNGIPHLLAPVVTDPRRASLALRKVVGEMEQRYELFSQTGTRNIEGYNEYAAKRLAEQASAHEVGAGETEPEYVPLPYIVVIVDELADLMMVAAGDVEDSIGRLAQMARAAGIHLIIATQRPSVNVITGVIKANIPSRIAFGVSSQVDSRTILDSAGAEKLLGRGDMLFLPVGASKPVRIQGAFLSDQEVEAVVQFAKQQGEAEYREELVPEVDDAALAQEEVEDELFDQAVQIIVEAKQASVSLLQRRMRIGYTRAARLIDSMEAKGIVGPYEGSKPREVLPFAEQYSERNVGS